MEKKWIFLIINILIILVFSTFFTTSVNAANTKITSEKFANEFNPTKEDGGEISGVFTNNILKITNIVLGILQTIGVIIGVLSIAIFGYNRILSANENIGNTIGMTTASNSANTRVAMMNLARNMLIGSVLLFSSITLVRIVFNIFLK